MAQNLISLEEAAKMLGVEPDELNRLREKREVFGIRDGSAWKFKPEEIQRYKEEMASGSSSIIASGMAEDFDLIGGGLDDDESEEMPGLDDDSSEESDEADVVLLSEEELGSSGPSTSSTVIGSPPPPGAGADESAIDLIGDSDLDLGGGDSSGVSLVPSDAGDSGVRLVASDSDLNLPDTSGVGSDLDLVDLGGESSGLTLETDSGPNLDGSSSDEATLEIGSDLSLGSDAASLSSEELSLAADSAEEAYALAEDAEGSSIVSAGGSSSGPLSLGDDEFDDDDIVLGGSSGVGGSSGLGSGIGDSGINLEAANDSGLSFEEPLELSDDLSGSSAEVEQLDSDDDFLLTPMLELDDQDSDSSGSQVIALDTEEPFDENAATLLGEDMPGMGVVDPGAALGFGGAQPLSTPAPAMAPQAPSVPEAKFTGLSVMSLTLVFLVLGFTGMMMFEMIRHIWSWGQPYEVSSTLMDSIINMIEGK